DIGKNINESLAVMEEIETVLTQMLASSEEPDENISGAVEKIIEFKTALQNMQAQLENIEFAIESEQGISDIIRKISEFEQVMSSNFDEFISVYKEKVETAVTDEIKKGKAK